MTTDALLNHSDCLVATSAFGTKLPVGQMEVGTFEPVLHQSVL